MAFANLSKPFADHEPGPFKILSKGMHPHVVKLLEEARQFTIEKRYRLWMYYVTLGAVSESLVEDAQETVASAAFDAVMEVLDGQRLMYLLRDYLDGVAPPIPTLDLDMEQHAGVKVNGVLQRFDATNRIETWVFSMRGDAVAKMYEFAGLRLYARNIRGFLGEKTPINDGMTKTLAGEPDHFFYYNNGITIICDRAEKRSHSGVDFLRVTNPQVINGQQTSRMLAHDEEKAKEASVLVKVMQVPREPGADSGDGFDTLVSQIVSNTNWQNAINYADLVSNDRVQIEIERALRKVGYVYLRKRQKKSEARKNAGKRFTLIKKEELAQAVTGCQMDPVTVREGKNNLFRDHYKTIFPQTDANFYLTRYWARKQVGLVSRGNPQFSYAAWMALHFLWSQLEPFLKSDDIARRFWSLCERRDEALCEPLSKAINVVFWEILAYYNANKGSGYTELDHSTFFRSKRGRHIEFKDFWDNKATRTAKFDAAWSKVKNVLRSGQD